MRHVVLVGMMGSGKSTVGKRVAKRLNRPFVDVDVMIEAKTGKTVAGIFADTGEPAFRRLEADEIAGLLAANEPAVIATGGGSVLDVGTRSLLRNRAFTIWLRADPKILAGRVQGDGSRPLLGEDSSRATLTELLGRREPLYSEVADEVVDVDSLSRERVVNCVVGFVDAIAKSAEAPEARA